MVNQLSTSVAQLICCANQLSGFYMRATLALNGLKKIEPNVDSHSSLGLSTVHIALGY